LGIDDHPISDKALFTLMKNTRRDEMADGLFTTHYKGMSRIISSLVPDHHIGLAGQKVNDLSLSFISPLGPHDNHVRHFILQINDMRAYLTKSHYTTILKAFILNSPQKGVKVNEGKGL
jgi:hypothetical protein